MKLNTDKIIAKVDGGIGWMIINNPERRNAISLEMRDAMTTVFEEFNRDSNVRVLVIRGNGGKAFISGADISEFNKSRNNFEAEKVYSKASERMSEAMNDFEKPIIAMIEGFCVGGGVATAIAADIRIASKSSKYSIPAAKLGLSYGFDNLRQLVDLVGPANAKWILFTSDMLDANKVYDMGLINKIADDNDLESVVIDTANKIVNNAPLTIHSAKTTIKHITRPEIRNLKTLDDMAKICFDSQDYREGREAFMGKRKPKFIGK